MPGYKFREKNTKERIKVESVKSPCFRILYPSSDSILTSGQSYDILWESSIVKQIYAVKLELYKDGILNSSISAETQNDGIYEWTVPALSEASTYQIKITSALNNDWYDFSDNFTTIMTGSITITAPTNLTQWTRGYTSTIIWESEDLDEDLYTIDLYKNGVFVYNIADDVTVQTYDWLVSLDLEVDSDYQIKVIYKNGVSIFDMSDNFNLLYDGYVRPDGDNDYVDTTITSIPDKVSFAFKFYEWEYLYPSKSAILGSPNGLLRIYPNATDPASPPEKLRIRSGSSSTQYWESYVAVPYNISAWHDIVITIDYTSNICKIYFDGNEDIGVFKNGSPSKPAIDTLTWFRLAGNYANGKFKHLKVWNKVISPVEAMAYHNEIYDAVDQLSWYRCNEVSGNLNDSSGNSRTGIVYNASPSFYNPL